MRRAAQLDAEISTDAGHLVRVRVRVRVRGCARVKVKVKVRGRVGRG